MGLAGGTSRSVHVVAHLEVEPVFNEKLDKKHIQEISQNTTQDKHNLQTLYQGAVTKNTIKKRNG